ncbi:serine--tRNA ligase [Haploplasma axanthum]|uniref:Serine--tRNA ligase n=1 Tax=Haploplasma axanthum TaxID=29552 RepID=A0A449BBF7_HAPAX|nr:serine--tRNA ligase [Haploplasma axanthum]VEU79737.1 seryl-tRNA synthetase [Haploplasma axanthum]
MLDLKYVVDNIDTVIEKLNTRNGNFDYLRELVTLSDERKNIINEVEVKKAFRNEASKQIGILKREKKDATKVLEEVAHLGDEIKELDEKAELISQKIKDILLNTPNIPDESIPVGKSEDDNLELRKYGKVREFDFPIKDHVELGENLDILEFERAAKITGARFVVYKGLGARLERALMQFMMDLHSLENGYTEFIPPYIVNEDSMYGTGQFPKFKEDAFKLEGRNWYLNPTAEVPMINLYRDEIIDGTLLPFKYVAYTSAFRSEAGSAGRDTRGILRQHQFQKVELINYTKPEDSKNALESMIKESELVLQKLGLPYRVVCLSTGDLGFSMTKTYDIEVWIPSQNKYREIGSISNANDYQARRANIRFKRDKNSKTEYVHTLNGSGLAVGRTVIAVMENYQNADGTITIPEVLVPYMKVNKITK